VRRLVRVTENGEPLPADRLGEMAVRSHQARAGQPQRRTG
jgi:hypothetical protein